MKTIELIEGELVDTVGGFTYRDVWCEIEDNDITFYERYYGTRADEFNEGGNKIEDKNEIKELSNMIKI